MSDYPWPVPETAFRELCDAIGDPSDERRLEVAVVLAALEGDRAAGKALEAYFDVIPPTLARMEVSADFIDEVQQTLRQRLLTGDPPKILRYVGRGSLRGLLKVSATREAISRLRKEGRESPADDALLDRTGERDPELQFLKERYRALFKSAFEAAVGTLEPRERNLLRLHFLRKVTLEKLATMYDVHRATIVRQLAAIRAKMDKETRASLRAQLELHGGPKGADELDEIMDLVRSRMDVSVDRLLATVME